MEEMTEHVRWTLHETRLANKVWRQIAWDRRGAVPGDWEKVMFPPVALSGGLEKTLAVIV